MASGTLLHLYLDHTSCLCDVTWFQTDPDPGCGVGHVTFIRSLMGNGSYSENEADISDGDINSCLSLDTWG